MLSVFLDKDMDIDNATITEALANMSVGAATAIGLFGYIEQHASLFSLLISLCGVIAAIIFYWLNYRMRKKEFKIKLKASRKGGTGNYSSFG